MRLTTIGTGTAAPTPGRVQSGHVVDAGAVKLLMDCGSGVATRLSDVGISWQHITHLAITHFHADHVVDVPTILYAWRYGQLPPRSEPLEIVGPVGTLRLLSGFAAIFGQGLLALGFPITVREMQPGDSITLGGDVRLACRKVPHTDESVAYSVEHGGRRIVYTGDTGPDEALGQWAAGCDVLLAECSLPDAMAIPTHLTPRQCGALGAAARPGVLALTHFYPPVEAVDIRGEVGAQFDGAVALATDGWTLDLEER
ncbi:MAG TPA: MBL fold metallo-hydrolase [Gemmatimonadaceae bacterium]|nr:MBL fold metallo-hydrolase [Gemmatimonadaceae bacterium]